MFKEFSVLKKTKESLNVHSTIESAWIIYFLLHCTDEAITAQRGEMTRPNHIVGVDITGRMERPLAVEQTSYSITHNLYDLGQIT